MKYEHIKEGVFLERPNRFIALVKLEEQICRVHVKNTGRCGELLIPGATVYVEDFGETDRRKTRYDLIAVRKADGHTVGGVVGKANENGYTDGKERLINMDSQAPNQVVIEALKSGALQLPGFHGTPTWIRPETTYGKSRLDVYLENEEQKAFVEVKGVTLEKKAVARFPDAPTVRGIKHVHELIKAKKQQFLAYLVFVIQMNDVDYFEPNDETHFAFGEALREAEKQGVQIIAYDCVVLPNELWLGKSVPVHL